MQLVIERLDATTREMRMTTRAMQLEHRADRRPMYAILKDHGVRIRALEKIVRAPRLFGARKRRGIRFRDTALESGPLSYGSFFNGVIVT